MEIVLLCLPPTRWDVCGRLTHRGRSSHSAFEPGPRHVCARCCAYFSSDARWMAELWKGHSYNSLP